MPNVHAKGTLAIRKKAMRNKKLGNIKLTSIKNSIFIILLLLVVACDDSGETPPEDPVANNVLSNDPSNAIENSSVIEISLDGQSGESTTVRQQLAGKDIEEGQLVNASFSNASGSLRTTSQGKGNISLSLTAIDADALDKVVLYIPSVTKSFILCSENCESDYQARVMAINPQLMMASSGEIIFELYAGDELANLVLVDRINIDWQPIIIASPSATRNNNTITVNWQDNPDLLRYNLYAATESGVTVTDTLTLENGIQLLAIDDTSAQFNDSAPTQAYQLLLTGIDFNGETSASASLTIPQVQQSESQAPIALADLYTIEEDQILTDNVIANDSDPNGQIITLSTISQLPKNGELEFNESGQFTYTPNLNFFGEDSFVYQITNTDNESSQASVVITILSINDTPTAVDDNVTLNRDNTVTIEKSVLLANDSDIEQDKLTVLDELATQPSFGSVQLNEDGSFTYTTDEGFLSGDSFEYQISDGNGGVAQASIFISIDISDDLPLALDDTYQVNEDDSLIIEDVNNGILANDSDPNNRSFQLYEALAVQPENGQLTLAEDGTFTYVPNNNFFGSDQFSYQIVNDAGNSAQAYATIDVVAQLDSPITADDSYQVDEDNYLEVTAENGLLKNDSDPDLGSLFMLTEPVSDVSNGSITIQNDGSFFYQPNSDFAGVDSFTYQVVNNNDFPSSSQVFITVINTNDDPVAVDDIYFHSDGTVFDGSSVLVNDTDVDGDSLTVDTTPVTDTINGTLTLFADGTFTYSPIQSVGDSFTYRVTDGNGGVSQATVTIDTSVSEL